MSGEKVHWLVLGDSNFHLNDYHVKVIFAKYLKTCIVMVGSDDKHIEEQKRQRADIIQGRKSKKTLI